ncbi:MAG TPA: chromate efflux transporter [Planctomycetota bacterium]|nr:chromate efflux transporter [Planctomycetota bacterium]HRR80339.1 chromate efflux transporter [Planctomycetota bacterium]HRT94145.1 chromate efflux transporter [Planctomycetota bacterium]
MPDDPRARSSLWEVTRLFLKLSVLSFGGPAGHIALMEDEVVARRGWLSRERFLDLVGATNLIPGPNAVEMAIHIGYLRRGWLGLLAAGASFIVPAVLITTAMAWAYVRYGTLPQVGPFLAGAKPAVLAVILVAVWRLGRATLKQWRLAAVGAAVLAGAMAGLNEVLLIFAGGLAGMLWLAHRGSAASPPPPSAALAILPWGFSSRVLATGAAAGAAAGVSLWALGLFFLKVGAVLYGSGYVLVAFLEGGLVREYGWLTQQQLLDAVAAGQVTPGPLLSSVAFVGYLLRGGAGAAVATVAVFLPSFVFVVLLSPVVPRLRESRWSSSFLDSVNVASVALMLAVGAKLGGETLIGWPSWAIAAAALVAGARWQANSAWLILGGAALGWLLGLRAT